MKIKQIVKEAPQLPAGSLDHVVQYISGPNLPKPGGEYRFEDVMKRVKELKDAIERAKQRGKLDVNSQAYKNIIAELQKWDQWLQNSQDINKWHPERLKEANYNDPDFNPRVEMARIVNLRMEAPGSGAKRKEEIEREIKQIEAQLRLWKATQPEQPRPQKEKRSDKGTPYTIYYDGQVSGRMLDTDMQGAKNVGKNTVMRQLAHTFAIVTDNKGNVVFVWYPGGHERPYEVGDKYNAPGAPDPYKDRPRYPAGHPHAGAPMPANVPVVTDWSKLPDGGLEAWMQGGQETNSDTTTQQRPEVYMGQAQRVDQQGGLPRPRNRR